MTKPVCD